MYFQFSLSWFILLVSFSCTVWALSNGPRQTTARRHGRRAATISEFLIPPAPPNHWQRQPAGPVNAAIRHGRTLGPQPPAPTPEPGYFARFMSWIYPFGDSAPEPTQPQPSWQSNNQQWDNNPGDVLQPPPLPQDSYGTRGSHQLPYQPPVLPPKHTPSYFPENNHSPQSQSPSTNQIRLPPLNGNDCNPCDKEPWTPILGSGDVNSRIATVPDDIKPGVNHISSPSYEVKFPDFGHNVPQTPGTQQPDIRSPMQVPIPYPHLFPGAVPPLFKAVPFDIHQQGSDRVTQTAPYDLPSGISGPPERNPDDRSNQQNLESPYPISDLPTHVPIASFPTEIPQSTEEYVEVLPPGAVTVANTDHIPPTLPEDYVDTRGSGSDIHPISENKNGNSNQTVHIVSDSGHVIHIEESPVFDLSKNEKNTNGPSSPSSTTVEDVDNSVILQNPDGSYGINSTWPTGDASKVSWPLDENSPSTRDSSAIYTPVFVQELASTSEAYPKENNKNTGSVVWENAAKNVSSLLIQAFKNKLENKNSVVTEKIVTTETPAQNGEPTISPFALEVIESYRNFLKDLADEEKATQEKSAQGEATSDTPKAWFDPRDIHPGNGFVPAPGTTQKIRDQESNQGAVSSPSTRQQGAKRNKQVQIIIPYTSQYTPSPFHRPDEVLSEPVGTQGRSVSGLSKLNQESGPIQSEDQASLLKILASLPELKKARPFIFAKTNTSIDPMRLQKNIDNWTILEYSRGTTASTELPSSYHPQLHQSKKIPDDYLTTTEPVSAAATIRDAEKAYGDILSGFSFNDLEHEGSSNNKVIVPHYRVPYFDAEESSEVQPTTSPSVESPRAENSSWEELPVSISTLSNERVYVVTPQSVKSKSLGSNISTTTIDEKEKETLKNPAQFESIERAYQVLPEAVNNLAVASTGPATIPLWGIMEHEQYAAPAKNSTTSRTPIQYSGHSKVSHIRH